LANPEVVKNLPKKSTLDRTLTNVSSSEYVDYPEYSPIKEKSVAVSSLLW